MDWHSISLNNIQTQFQYHLGSRWKNKSNGSQRHPNEPSDNGRI